MPPKPRRRLHHGELDSLHPRSGFEAKARQARRMCTTRSVSVQPLAVSKKQSMDFHGLDRSFRPAAASRVAKSVAWAKCQPPKANSVQGLHPLNSYQDLVVVPGVLPQIWWCADGVHGAVAADVHFWGWELDRAVGPSCSQGGQDILIQDKSGGPLRCDNQTSVPGRLLSVFCQLLVCGRARMIPPTRVTPVSLKPMVLLMRNPSRVLPHQTRSRAVRLLCRVTS